MKTNEKTSKTIPKKNMNEKEKRVKSFVSFFFFFLSFSLSSIIFITF